MNNSNPLDGELKLSNAVDSGSGDVVREAPENASMVAGSEISTQPDRQRTKRGASLSPDQTLEILQQSVINCQAAGIEAKVSSFFDRGQQAVVVVLYGVAIKDGNLVADIGKGLP